MAYVDIHDQPGPHRDFFELDAVGAATATDDYTVWHAPFRCKIRDVCVIFDEAIEGQDDDTFILQVYNWGHEGEGPEGEGEVALDIPETFENGWVADVDTDAFEAYGIYDPDTFDPVPDLIEAVVGTVLSVMRTRVGDGMDMPRLVGFVEYEGN